MKAFLKILGVGVALFVATPAIRSWAQDYSPDNAAAQPAPQPDAIPGENADSPTGSISFEQFYNSLTPYGSWINTDKYGYVFQPNETDPNWAPYTNGRWVNSDQGLTWVGNDPFSWATDHYGRWANLEGHGWVWVPGYTWAPAWVSWRQSDNNVASDDSDQSDASAQSDDNDYVGWAPLPPDSDYGIDYYDSAYPDDYGYHIGDDCDLAYGIGPWWYTFCPVIYLGDSDCWHHYYGRDRNFGLIGHTRNVTNINFRRDGSGGSRFGHVQAEGPSLASLNARAQTPIQNVRLTRASTLDNAGLHGGTLAAFAPRVNPATLAGARPANVSQNIGITSVNHGTNVSHGLAVNSRLAAPAASTAQIQEAQSARQGFGNARVPTNDTAHFARAFNGSIRTMRTSPNVSGTSGSTTGAFTPAVTPRVSNTAGYSQFRPSPNVQPGRAPVPVNHNFAASLPSNFGAAPVVPVYRAPVTPRIYTPSPGYSQFRSPASTPPYTATVPAVHTFTPTPHVSNVPSFSGDSHFSSGSSFSGGAHFSGGGFSGGGFSGGGHSGGGGFSGGGGGGAGHSGGGGGGGGGGHR